MQTNLLLPFLFLLLSISPPSVSADSAEAQALLRWKSSLVRPSSLSSWSLANSTSPCTWFGVSCDASGNVVQLSLPDSQINGTLRELNFSSLSGLTSIDLSNNLLHGSIPAGVSALSKLTFLDLGSNRFSGSIPSEIGRLSEIFHLLLYNNSLVGPIPYQLSNLQKLQYLQLDSNDLENPEDYSKFKALPQPTILGLSGNRLSGEFPPFILNCRNITFLDLSVPECFGELQNLKRLNIAKNELSGTIPWSPSSLPSLQSLHLNGNSFTGEFPSFLEDCKSLSVLDIGDNDFFGNIPTWIGNALPSLRVLRLQSNRFSGNIPPEISELTSLQLLDLANNNLSGYIPSSLENLVSMDQENIAKEHQNSSLSYNDDSISINWKGNYHEITTTLWLVTGIDLSGNHLIGEIPKGLMNLSGLIFLNLSRNDLNGTIPERIDRIKSLECLDLSTNHLSGTIPESITSLTFLAFMNLSNNNLSGRVPTCSQMQTYDPSLYSGNEGLCGPPLMKTCSDDLVSSDEQMHEKREEKILLYLSVVSGFSVGFWIFVGTLCLKQSWRFAYFHVIDYWLESVVNAK